MKHTLAALALSLGLVGSGCAHGQTAARPDHPAVTLALVGLVVLGVASLFVAQSEGSPQCTDPLGRCGDYEPAPPMR